MILLYTPTHLVQSPTQQIFQEIILGAAVGGWDVSNLNVDKRPALQTRMVERFGYKNNKWDKN